MSLICCWEIQNCNKTECPAYKNFDSPCFYIDGTECGNFKELGKFPDKLNKCRGCVVYNAKIGDEMKHFTQTFGSIVRQFKVFEKELSVSEDKYRNFFENNPHPIIICNCDFNIIDSNNNAVYLYNYSKQNFLSLTYDKIASVEEMKLIAEKCFDKNTTPLFLKKRIHQRADGNYFFADIVASQISYSGKTSSVMISITDVTDSVEKEALLIHSNKLATLGQMASGIAHEINQPLTSIMLGINLLKSFLNNPEVSKIANDIELQIIRASSIIKQIREFSRKSSNKDINVLPSNKNFSEVNINEAIKNTIVLLGDQINSCGISLELHLYDKLPFIKGDKIKLEQVFLNMIGNSRDAILEKNNFLEKKIIIKSFVKNFNIYIEIFDNGNGMNENTLKRIFDPFFTTKEIGKGTGLGLSISSNIIRSHGGIIKIDTTENLGTTMKIIFKIPEKK